MIVHASLHVHPSCYINVVFMFDPQAASLLACFSQVQAHPTMLGQQGALFDVYKFASV